ncbi:MAG: DUF47 family protein [Clostridiales Family XIII bacterium]|jgi:predicted phosphate transport protein (TIGR00153 family)|nr:DUF47 family protein [Clostridiales Family XIII bacterium]
MAKKDEKYFNAFCETASTSVKAAEYLRKIINDYDENLLHEKIKIMHDYEHEGDIARHKIMRILEKEFITPFEREDIVGLLESIDDVTDKIEDVLLRLYMFDIKVIEDDAREMIEILVKCTQAVLDALIELKNFKKSKILMNKIILINELEEEGDSKYIEAVRNIVTKKKDPIAIVAWNQIYTFIESVYDSCEDVSDLIESIVMKNT